MLPLGWVGKSVSMLLILHLFLQMLLKLKSSKHESFAWVRLKIHCRDSACGAELLILRQELVLRNDQIMHGLCWLL